MEATPKTKDGSWGKYDQVRTGYAPQGTIPLKPPMTAQIRKRVAMSPAGICAPMYAANYITEPSVHGFWPEV